MKQRDRQTEKQPSAYSIVLLYFKMSKKVEAASRHEFQDLVEEDCSVGVGSLDAVEVVRHLLT